MRMTIGRRRYYEAAGARWLRPVPDALRRLADHVSAFGKLLRTSDGGLAPGAAAVAGVVALRLAATRSEDHAAFVRKWDALGAFGRLADHPLRMRFARLCDVARRVEVGRPLADGLSVAPSDVAADMPSAQAALRVDPAAIDLYVDVLWVRGDLDRVSSLVASVFSDARELDGGGAAATREGVDAYLCDIALGLCLRPPASAPEVVDHAALLDALRPAARARPAVEAMIDVALAIDGGAWDGMAP